MEFKITYHKVCPGHPVHMPVHMFVRTQKKLKHYLTMPYHQSKSDKYNVLVTSSNSCISHHIMKKTRTKLESSPITVAKHLGEVMQLDVVVLINTYCDIKTKQQAWDLYYYKPTCPTVAFTRLNLQSDYI